jgi:hypothetical protein
MDIVADIITYKWKRHNRDVQRKNTGKKKNLTATASISSQSLPTKLFFLPTKTHLQQNKKIASTHEEHWEKKHTSNTIIPFKNTKLIQAFLLSPKISMAVTIFTKYCSHTNKPTITTQIIGM